MDLSDISDLVRWLFIGGVMVLALLFAVAVGDHFGTWEGLFNFYVSRP